MKVIVMERHNRKPPRRGFTLVELMVVVVIIGLLAGIVGLNVINNIGKAKVTKAKAQIKVFNDAVINYKVDTGVFPLALEDLVTQPADVENWQKGGYLLNMKSIPVDPWGYEYGYEETGGSDDYDYYIWSLGADGQEGGEDEDADIYNVDLVEEESAGGF